MTGAGIASSVLTVLAVLCALLSHAAAGEQGRDSLRPRQQMPSIGVAPAEAEPESLVRGARDAAAQQQDPLLEQTRLRVEQHLKAQRELDGEFKEPEERRRNTRFGVGYEWRMKSRQGSSASGSLTPGPALRGPDGRGPGGAMGGGFGGRR